jgi:hypothetical protein
MSTSQPGSETFEKKVLSTEKDKITYYTEKARAESTQTYEEQLFINLSIRKIFENISKTFVGIMNEFLTPANGKPDYIAILSREDRLIYLGIIILLIGFGIYLVDITN